MSPETITHGHVGDAASMKVKTKFNQLRRWLGHRSELSTPASRRDASTSTTDLVQSASRILDDEEHAFATAAIRSTGLCHIAHVPVEILCEIFIHCLPLHECDDRYLSPRIYEAPMLLCHVCCHWRRVALSLTVLWSSFSGSCWFNTKPDTFALVQCFLDRSQNHPISIEFGDDTSPSVRQLLFANLHRWRNVSIELDDEIVKELLGLPVGVATILESLSMRIGYDCEATLEKIPTILPLFPHIRRLHFDTIQSHKSLLPNIPWTQLTHIRLQCELSLDDCVMSLGRCEKAEHIQIAHIIPSGPVRSALVTLPYLAHLDVVLTDDIGMFLDHFILPSLHTLQYTTGATTRRNVWAIESLAQRSSCTLEVLHIRDIRMLEDDLIGYLSLPCLRSLQELDIYNIDNIRDRTLSLLVYPSAAEEEGILPHLRRLKLRLPVTSDGLFSAMIASRWGTSNCRNLPASLRNVSVEFPRTKFQHLSRHVSPHDLDILRFAEFTEQGLSISFDWP